MFTLMTFFCLVILFVSAVAFIFKPQRAYSFVKERDLIKYMDNISIGILAITFIAPILRMVLDINIPFLSLSDPVILLALPIWVIIRSRHIRKYGQVDEDYQQKVIRNLIIVSYVEIFTIVALYITFGLLILLGMGRL